jgi:hypothetical protein
MKRHLYLQVPALMGLLALFSPVISLANVATSGVASQSSDISSFGELGAAEHAIDGDRRGIYFDSQVAVTDNPDPSPTDDGLFDWWQVELDQDYSIFNILVFNRTDCCGFRLAPFRVEIFDDDAVAYTEDVQTFVETITDDSVSGMYFEIPDVTGDRVKITILERDFLQLAEVEVNALVTAVPLPAGIWLLGSAAVLSIRRRHKTS